MLHFFLLGDMFASKRDILALLVRYIVASLCAYDINPLMPRRAYRLPKANITLEGNIANHARDLYRCVLFLTDNTLTEWVFVALLFCFAF